MSKSRMEVLQDILFNLTGEKPSEEDLSRLNQMLLAAGVRDNDPFALLFAVLEHYYKLYSGVPEKIKALMNEGANEAAITIRNEAECFSDVISRKKSLSKALLFIIVFLVFVVIGQIYYISNIQEKNIKYIESLGQSIDYIKDNTSLFDKIDKKFFYTKEYQWAKNSYNTGTLTPLYECSGRGWKVENGLCVPYSWIDEKGESHITGWEIE